MSGNKVIPILELHKDVYVHGGAVRKKKYTDRNFATELVLCVACTFKLHQHPAKKPAAAAPAATPTAADGGPSAAPPLPQAPPQLPKPLMQWRMSHAYVHAVVPIGGDPRFGEPFGFAVLFYSFKPPKEKNVTPLMQDVATHCTACKFTDLMPRLRSREYVCASDYEQEDWIALFRVVLNNYWHERLERSTIPAPEIYQFQCFSCALNGAVQQLALSTTRLYVIPRSDQKSIESDSPTNVKSFVIASAKRCVLLKDNRLLLQFGAGDANVGFLSHSERSTFVIELQRIFELCVGVNVPFPIDAEAQQQ